MRQSLVEQQYTAELSSITSVKEIHNLVFNLQYDSRANKRMAMDIMKLVCNRLIVLDRRKNYKPSKTTKRRK